MRKSIKALIMIASIGAAGAVTVPAHADTVLSQVTTPSGCAAVLVQQSAHQAYAEFRNSRTSECDGYFNQHNIQNDGWLTWDFPLQPHYTDIWVWSKPLYFNDGIHEVSACVYDVKASIYSCARP
ncbi:hypothetical protein [Actinomadura rupiterrae]|uniref:hypothetical protein n=1 Tax=Actinomadura rupiterrae TaxID=559627 RepID=UPI0020A38026|nr:hypothetical protein [Actinomadura rupiterrae]MCP2342344.1 hypothetical protein [Actinomadura rupiterrae]